MSDYNELPPTGQANEPTQTGPAAEPQPAAYCQNCGRPLTRDSARTVGQAVFCEPCLEARVSGTNPYMPVNAPTPEGSAMWTAGSPSAPNPVLATLLGFIPGVGAMYNGQYAKGIVHLIVFVCLVTVADAYNIFGLFVAGWEFYMAIDANHTARARRDGLPLPNPFGLNEIGERLGFGKAWGNSNAAYTAPSHPGATRSDAGPFASAGSTPPPYTPPPYTPPPYTPPPYAAQPYAAQPYTAQPTQPFAPPPAPSWGAPAAYTPTWTHENANTGVPPAGGYTAPYPPAQPGPLSRFPSGAVWLIGLGSIFLLATTGLFNAFSAHAVIGLALIGLGIWSFLRRMSESGPSLHDDGSPLYRYRVLRALRVPVWLVLIGLWFLLDSFHLIRLHHTWPVILIIAGVLSLLERLIFNSLPPMAAGAPAYGAPGWEPAHAPPVETPVANDPVKGGN